MRAARRMPAEDTADWRPPQCELRAACAMDVIQAQALARGRPYARWTWPVVLFSAAVRTNCEAPVGSRTVNFPLPPRSHTSRGQVSFAGHSRAIRRRHVVLDSATHRPRVDLRRFHHLR